VNNEQIFATCKMLLRNCVMWEGDENAQDYGDAWDYYLQRLRGDEIPGRSTAVAGDVSASVEANLAQMLDAFSSDSIAEFDPLDAEDEDQASLESDVVTHFVMKTQNGFLELASAIKNALVARDAIIKVWDEEYEETTTRVYGNVAPEVHELVAPEAELLSYDPDERELRTREARTYKRFCVRAVDNANFFYPKDWPSQDFQQCPGVFERHVDTRSELIRMGFSKAAVARCTPVSTYGHTPADTVKNVRQVAANTSTRYPDSSIEQVEWFEGYVLLDVDGDDIAERRRICFHYDDGEILGNDPEEIVGYAKGITMLMPNRATGISQYDKLRQTQDEHTGLKRALYDNVNAVTKNRLAYLDGPTNEDDIADGRPNGGVRVRKGGNDGVEDIRAAVMPLQVADNSANILANIDALKRERAEMGGAALDLASAQAQVGGPNARLGSQGLDRAYSAMEQLAAMMTKTVASTLIRSVWLLAHAVIRRSWSEPINIRRSGAWQKAVPAQWRPRSSVTVRIGMSPGERARMAGALQTMLGAQMQLAQLGMDEVLVNAQKFYRTMMQWCRVSDLRNPEQYWIDPSSPPAQQAFQQKQQAAQQQNQQRQNLMDRAIGTRETEVALDKYKHDSSLQHSYWSDVLGSEVDEAKIVGKATSDLLLARETPQLPKPETGKGAKA
jgi:hypothetical protein